MHIHYIVSFPQADFRLLERNISLLPVTAGLHYGRRKRCHSLGNLPGLLGINGSLLADKSVLST